MLKFIEKEVLYSVFQLSFFFILKNLLFKSGLREPLLVLTFQMSERIDRPVLRIIKLHYE